MLPVALPPITPFELARTARGPRALDLVAQGGGRSAAGRTKKGLAQDWRSIHDWLLLQDPVAGGATAAWAPRRARRSPDIHSGLVRAGFVPICKRSRIVRVGLQEGWYPPNTEVDLSRTRVPGMLGESGFVS